MACERATDEVDEVSYLITFDTPYTAPDAETVDVTAEVGRALFVPVVNKLTGPKSAKSTLRVQEPSPALGGTFTVTFGGETSEEFAYNVGASSMQNSLNENVASFNEKLLVEGEGNGDGAAFYFIVGTRDGTSSPITVTGSFTGGQDDVVNVSTGIEVQANDNQFWWAIPNEMLHTFDDSP